MATKTKKRKVRDIGEEGTLNEDRPKSAKAKRGEKVTRRFRILAGSHTIPPKTDEDGAIIEAAKTFGAGEVVESDLPLHEMFMNKFEVVSTRSKEEAAEGRFISRVDETELDVNDDIMDEHPQDEGAVINPDSPQNVRRAGRRRALKEREQQQAEVADRFGDDVSDDYEDASNAGLRVYRKGDSFHVLDSDDLESPLTPRKGIKEKDVDKFLSKYVESDEDEE
jgi:hypothetical protein